MGVRETFMKCGSKVDTRTERKTLPRRRDWYGYFNKNGSSYCRSRPSYVYQSMVENWNELERRSVL